MTTAPMNATPFFGSKISLISKSEIRYEGILYTVDAKESTIALSQVRSFGSEDRPVEKPVPPREEIFQYIIFRASDIKDLIVDQPPSPALTDPAIIQAPSSINAGQSSSSIQQLQAGLQNAMAAMPKSSSSQQHSAPGTLGPASVPNVHDSNKANKPPASIAQVVASGGQQQQQQQQHKQQPQHQPANKQQQPQQLPQRNNSNQMNRLQNAHNPQPNRNNQHQDGVTSGGGQSGGSGANSGAGGNVGNFTGNRTNNFNRRLNVTRTPMNGGFNQRNVSNFNNRNFANRFQQRQPTGFYSYNRRPNRNFVTRPNQKPTISLPDSDFDFEKAQDEFKQLEEKLANLKVNGDANTPTAAPEATTTSTNNTANSEPQPSQPAASALGSAGDDASKDPCYNKEKSFFDKISCESLERERGHLQRVDWKAERKLNRETFGVVAPIRRNNGFRPNNRFSSGGGGHGGYRSYQNYRNRNSTGSAHNSNNPSGVGNSSSSSRPISNSNAVSSSTGGQSTSTTAASVVAATTHIVVQPAKN